MLSLFGLLNGHFVIGSIWINLPKLDIIIKSNNPKHELLRQPFGFIEKLPHDIILSIENIQTIYLYKVIPFLFLPNVTNDLAIPIKVVPLNI